MSDIIRTDAQSLARVWDLAGPLRGKLARSVLYRLLQSFALGMGFAAVLWLIDTVAGGAPVDAALAWRVTAMMGVSLALQLLFGYLSVSTAWLSTFEIAGIVRLGLLDRLRALPLGFHLSRHAGDTSTVLTSDMQMVESFLSDGLPRIGAAFGVPLAVFAYLLSRDPLIALAAIASVVITAPIFVALSRRLARLGIERQDVQAEAGGRMIEFVRGLSVIRSFNQLAQGQEMFRSAIDRFRDISVGMVIALSAPMALVAALVLLGAPLVVLVTGWRLESGAIGAGTALGVLVLVFALYTPILSLLDVMEMIRIADASLTRADRILTAEPMPEPTAPQAPEGHGVSFDAVQFGYDGGTGVLNGVSFEVPEGQMCAIVGPSGTGKSTILSLISRFWDVTGGAIRIGGVDLRDMSEADRAALVTMVFQEVYLFAGTIGENIHMGRPEASQAEIEEAARAAQAHDFIISLPQGYDTPVGEAGATLSGGERQRVSIARAILKDAPIVLLDEATAAIDPSSERALQEALSRLTEGRTLIVVAHRLSTIRSADQILVLEGGGISQQGTHDALLAEGGLYARFWTRREAASRWHLGDG